MKTEDLIAAINDTLTKAGFRIRWIDGEETVDVKWDRRIRVATDVPGEAILEYVFRALEDSRVNRMRNVLADVREYTDVYTPIHASSDSPWEQRDDYYVVYVTVADDQMRKKVESVRS